MHHLGPKFGRGVCWRQAGFAAGSRSLYALKGCSKSRLKAKSGSPAKREEYIAFYDLEAREVRRIPKDKFGQQLDRVIATLKASMAKAKTIEDYSLKTIDLTLGVSAGIVVVTVQGGITLHYEGPRA